LDEPDPLSGAFVVEDLEPLARERMQPGAFDYFAGGAGDEWTLAENRRAFERWVLRPRYLVDVSGADTRATVLGQAMPFPILLAPTAFHLLANKEGEVATARGAAAAGATMCVSTSATRRIGDIMATGVPAWFQLYVHQKRDIAERVVRLAEDAGCRALVLTIDLPILGPRLRDARNAFAGRAPHPVVMDLMAEAAEALYPGMPPGDLDDLPFDASLSWRDIEWVRGLSSLPLLLKGVMTAEDALLAVEHGADGVVVSNHGGRQLDGVAGTMDALPEVVEAAAGRAEVLLDGGVRRGTDVVKALALGAAAVLIGRPYLWGLAAAGDRGVRWVLETLRDEFAAAMRLTGATTVAGVTRTMVAPAPR
jgi:4-hydroxymandelate oxidase